MKVVRYLLIVLAAFLLLCGVAAVAVPLLVDHVVLARIGDSIGRQVAIERVRFNPFTLTLTARGVRVSGQEPATDFVTIDEARADLGDMNRPGKGQRPAGHHPNPTPRLLAKAVE